MSAGCPYPYFAATARVADPPKLLRTVMFTGFTGHVNWPLNNPAPLLVRVPINCSGEVTRTDSTADALVLVASTRSCPLETTYSARVMATVSAEGGGAGGVTVSSAGLVTPPKEAEMVAEVDAATDAVVAVNVALVCPAATVTLPLTGTWATAVLLLERVTSAPAAGAAPLRVTVATEELPPTTLVAFSARPETVRGGGGAGGETVSSAVLVTPPKDAETVTEVDAATDKVDTVNVALLLPAASVTLAGTVATAVLLLERFTTIAAEGAALMLTAPCEVLPPATLAGLTDSVDKLAAAGAAWGVKRRVAENEPNTPAAFCARTRHHKRCAGRPPMAACDTLTIWFAVKGAAIVEESST